MAHQRHANFLHDAGLHKAGIESVAEIMEANVADPSMSENRLPRCFDDPNRSVPECHNKAFGLTLG